MLASEKDFFTNKISVVRNELLMSLFKSIGTARQQGIGGCEIYEAALQQNRIKPSHGSLSTTPHW